jgi:hypothetical protein
MTQLAVPQRPRQALQPPGSVPASRVGKAATQFATQPSSVLPAQSIFPSCGRSVSADVSRMPGTALRGHECLSHGTG